MWCENVFPTRLCSYLLSYEYFQYIITDEIICVVYGFLLQILLID